LFKDTGEWGWYDESEPWLERGDEVALSLPSGYAEGGRVKAGARGTNFSLPRISVDEAGVGGRCEEAMSLCGRKGMTKSGTLMVPQAIEYGERCSRKGFWCRQGEWTWTRKGMGGLD